MLDFLFHSSDSFVFLFMVCVTIVFSLMLIILNKVFIFYKLRYKDNTITASIGSLIGIIYGVLTGFTCLYLLDNQDHATVAALNEGTAAADIYRETRWLKNPLKEQLQSDLKTYITKVVSIEWPKMTKGENVGIENSFIINKMSDELSNYTIVTQRDSLIVNNLIQNINSLFKARQERIQLSTAELSSEIWEVILISTILIIVINYAYRVNFYLHVFSITAFAIMAASILFLLVTLDRPFQGEFIVEPDALNAVLQIMQHDKV